MIKIGQNHAPTRESIDNLFEKLKRVIPSTGDSVDGSNLSSESGMSTNCKHILIVVYTSNV